MASQQLTLAVLSVETAQKIVAYSVDSAAVGQNQGENVELSFPADAPSRFWIHSVYATGISAPATAVALTAYDCVRVQAIPPNQTTMFEVALEARNWTNVTNKVLMTLPHPQQPLWPYIFDPSWKLNLNIPILDSNGSPNATVRFTVMLHVKDY